MITVPPVEDEEREPRNLSREHRLCSIIKPRVEEILEMVRDRLARLLSRQSRAVASS